MERRGTDVMFLGWPHLLFFCDLDISGVCKEVYLLSPFEHRLWVLDLLAPMRADLDR